MSSHIPRQLAEDLAAMTVEGENVEEQLREMGEIIWRKRSTRDNLYAELNQVMDAAASLDLKAKNKNKQAIEVTKRVEQLLDHKQKDLSQKCLPSCLEYQPARICPDVGFTIRLPDLLQGVKLPSSYLNEAKERFNAAIKAKRREIQSMEVRLKIKEVVYKESRGMHD